MTRNQYEFYEIFKPEFSIELITGKKININCASLFKKLSLELGGKNPSIIFNDARGFYANRCIIPYINEGLLMIKEGILPQMIENAALQLGMPLGPLQLIDEVSIELAINIAEQTKKAMGTNKLMEEIEIVLSTMNKAKRLGKKTNAGFYNYDEKGKRSGYWEGLKNNFEILKVQPDINVVKDRLALIPVSYTHLTLPTKA